MTGAVTVRLSDLPFALVAQGPAAGWTYDGDGALSASAGPRQDRFVPPGGPGGTPDSDAPRLLGTPPGGDFQLIARVAVGFEAAFDAGVLYLHVGDREWAKLCYELSPARPTVVSVVTRGRSDDANGFEVPGTTVWLRVTRTGTAFAFHASDDGETWTFVRFFALGTPEDAAAAQAGFLVQSPTGEGCRVVFDRISYRPYAPKDLRDGS